MLWVLAATFTIFSGSVLLTSCSMEDNPVVEPKDEPVSAYRALLKSLDWGQDTTFVYGHKIPDVDAVCSSLGLAKLMRELGYNCKAKVSSGTNRETEYIAREMAEAVIGPSLREGVTLSETRLGRKQIVPLIQDWLAGK